jgi:hypothetical protein
MGLILGQIWSMAAHHSPSFPKTKGLFVSASGSFWPPKAAANCQTLSFSASFYKIRWSKNYPKST